jgi:DNA-directed RNA polymerase specialized sigma24 family protein
VAAVPDPEFAAGYAAAYLRVVRPMVTDRAEDITQDAFARALQRWRLLRTYEDPEAWARRVAVNLACSRLSRLRTASRHLLGGAAGHAAASQRPSTTSPMPTLT